MWKSSFPTLPSTVGGSCQVLDVGPLPPDPVTNLQLLSTRKRFSIDRKSVRVAANISWTAPEFIGTEGSIIGYQVWFNAVPASSNVTRFVTHGALARSAEVEMVFDVGDTDFSLFLQVKLTLSVSHSLPPPPPLLSDSHSHSLSIAKFLILLSLLSDSCT